MAYLSVNPEVTKADQRRIGVRQYSDGTLVPIDVGTGQIISEARDIVIRHPPRGGPSLELVFNLTTPIDVVNIPFYGQWPVETAEDS